MSNYTLTQAEFTALKSRLTRVVNAAKRTGDHQAVVDEAQRAQAVFAEKGWPDDWARWQRAEEDARLALLYAR